MKKIKLYTGIFAALISGSLMAEPLPVTASFSILGDVTKQICGDLCTVQTIIRAGDDAHAYTMSKDDVLKIKQSKLLLFNGLGFERAELVRAAKESKVPLYFASDKIKTISTDHEHETHGHDHDHDFDPHIWGDPILMKEYAANIADALTRVDPANKVHYQSSLKKYQADMVKLDAWAKQMFSAIPLLNRTAVIPHESLNYLGHRYQVNFLAPMDADEAAEPSAKAVAEIIRQIKQKNIKAIFTESTKPSRVIEQIAKAANKKVSGMLYVDSLGNGNPATDTYINMFQYNVEALRNAMK